MNRIAHLPTDLLIDLLFIDQEKEAICWTERTWAPCKSIPAKMAWNRLLFIITLFFGCSGGAEIHSPILPRSHFSIFFFFFLFLISMKLVLVLRGRRREMPSTRDLAIRRTPRVEVCHCQSIAIKTSLDHISEHLLGQGLGPLLFKLPSLPQEKLRGLKLPLLLQVA